MAKIPRDKQCWRPGCTRKGVHKIKWDGEDKIVCNGHKSDEGQHWVRDRTINRKVACVCEDGKHRGIPT